MAVEIVNEVSAAFRVLADTDIVYLAAHLKEDLGQIPLLPLELLQPLPIPHPHHSLVPHPQHILQEFPLPLLLVHIVI